MKRSNKYEAAFESYLQSHRLGYVAVDESRRAFLGDQPVKNLDFIVLAGGWSRLLVDVKGRRFPGGVEGRQRWTWENWSTQEDVDGLERWVELFGLGYQGLLVFMYDLQPSVHVPEDTTDLFTWRGERYLLRAVPIRDYRRHMRVRSPRWGTVALPGNVFRRLVRPFQDFVAVAGPEYEESWSHDAFEDWDMPEIAATACAGGSGGGPAPGGFGD
jgi:hypothetical protein